MCCDLVGYDVVVYILVVGQVQVFFGGDVVEYCSVVLVDYCCIDCVGDVVVIGGDVGGQWFQCVEWCFIVFVQLFVYVFFDQLYWYVVGVFDYGLYVVFLCDFG